MEIERIIEEPIRSNLTEVLTGQGSRIKPCNMARKLGNPNLNNNKDGKRILKPVIEKKRRDRINQSLGELRKLLLNNTSDARLQNPKIEKAEILDLAVEYLQKWTDRQSLSNDSTNDNSGQMKDHCVSMVSLPHSSGPSAPTLFTVETAGFQQCVAQLTNYMHKITPAQRMGLIQELKGYAGHQYPNSTGTEQHPSSWITDLNLRMNQTETSKRHDAAPLDNLICNSQEEASNLTFVPHHSSCHPCHCYSIPCHEYLSPPPSPYLSHPSSAYSTPPPFSSVACHFSFPPKMAPLSSNTSLSTHSVPLPVIPAPVSFSPTLPVSGPPTFHFPSPTTLRSPVFTPREGLPANQPSSVWRPWS